MLLVEHTLVIRKRVSLGKDDLRITVHVQSLHVDVRDVLKRLTEFVDEVSALSGNRESNLLSLCEAILLHLDVYFEGVIAAVHVMLNDNVGVICTPGKKI